MNINTEVVCQELSRKYTIRTISSFRPVVLASPLIYDGSPCKPGHLYLISAEDFAEMKDPSPGTALVICSSMPWSGICCMHSGSCDILAVVEPVSVFSLFNEIAEIFDRFNSWEQELIRYAGKYTDISRVLSCSHDILGGTLTLVDDNFNLLAYTDDFLQWEGYYDKGSPLRTPQPLIDAALEDPDYRKGQTKTGVFLYPEYPCGNNALCCNLFRSGSSLFYARLILMNRSGEYSASQTFLLSFLARVIHRTLSGVSSISLIDSSYRKLGDLIRNVLRETPHYTSTLQVALQAVSWEMHDHYLVTILVCPFEKNEIIQTPSLCNRLETLLEETCALLYEDSLVLITNVTRTPAFQQNLFNQTLTVFLRENLFKAGVSNRIPDFAMLSAGYREASAALEIGSKKDPSLWYYHFGNYVLDYILQEASREISLIHFIDERLLFLRDYDRENHSEFYKTLKTFIQQKYSATKTAEVLFVHRTTLLSRLDRIFQLTQIDLNKWETRLILMLSIYALDNH